MDTSTKTAAEYFVTQVSPLIDWLALAPSIQAIADRLGTEVPVAAVKMLLLARWYSLNEASLVEACQDRLSFRRFLELPPEDDSVHDARLAGIYRRQISEAPLEAQNVIHAIETQLLAGGYSIRPGLSVEATVMPIAEGRSNDAKRPAGVTSPADFQRLLETSFFQPGEMDDLLKHGESVFVRGGARVAMSTPAPRRSTPEDLPPLPAMQTTASKTVVEWPWGHSMDLSTRLNIGRDHRFCMFAPELQPYLHVSRKHAELEPCAEGVWIRDLKSRNGTFVNDEEVPKGQAYLVDGDANVRFGPHCLLRVKITRSSS